MAKQAVSKEETLANLYALRAGLSVASGLCDDVKAQENALAKYKRQRAGLEKEKKEKNEALEREGAKQKQYAEETAKAKEDILLLEVAKEQNTKYKNKLSFALAFFAIGFAVFFPSLGMASDKSFKFGTIGMICALASVLVAIVLGVMCLLTDKRIRNYTEKQLTDVQARLKTLVDQQAQYVIDCRDIVVFNQNTDKALQEMQENEQKAEENKTAQLAKFPPLYQGLQTVFAPVLDEREWKNLDLILYNLETDRAETVRDGLLQADAERRNNRLETAVAEATAELSISINGGLQPLQAQLETCYKELAKQTKKAKNTALQELISPTAMQQALQSKAGTTSTQLVADLLCTRDKAQA